MIRGLGDFISYLWIYKEVTTMVNRSMISYIKVFNSKPLSKDVINMALHAYFTGLCNIHISLSSKRKKKKTL